MSQRTYTDEEVRTLLERAVELQSQKATSASKQGLTLDELEEIAAASDIDPTHLKQAAHELEAQTQKSTTSTRTSNTHVFVDCTVPGRLPDHAWNDILIELRRRFGLVADKERITEERTAASLSWTHVDKDDVETQVYVDAHDGTVQVRLSQYVAYMGPVSEALVWGVLVSLVFGSLAALFVYGDSTAWTILGGYIALFLFTLPIAYGVDVKRRKAAQEQLNDLVDLITRHVEPVSPGADAQPEPPSDVSTPRRSRS